jgi:hypothetical protein
MQTPQGRTKGRIIVRWLIGNALLYGCLVATFAIWIDHEVREEYRLGLRTTTDGDIIAIPIFGFAMVLGITLLGLNTLYFAIRWYVRARRVKVI